MTQRKNAALKRGLRMAAKVAAVAGLVAAGAAQAQAAPPGDPMARENVDATERTVEAAELAEKVRIGGAKSCGCAPCWGPPAPPAMNWLEAA